MNPRANRSAPVTLERSLAASLLLASGQEDRRAERWPLVGERDGLALAVRDRVPGLYVDRPNRRAVKPMT